MRTVSSVATCCVRPTAHTAHALSMGKTQHFFVFCPWWPWPLTLTFERGRDFCTMHLTAKFHHPTLSCSEVIVRTNKHNDKQTDAAETFPRFATLRQWVITDWVKVLCPTRHKIGHFRDILRSQSLGTVLKKLNPTQQKHTYTHKLFTCVCIALCSRQISAQKITLRIRKQVTDVTNF